MLFKRLIPLAATMTMLMLGSPVAAPASLVVSTTISTRPPGDGPAGAASAPVLLRRVHASVPAAIVHVNDSLPPHATGQAGYPVPAATLAHFRQSAAPATAKNAAPVTGLAPLQGSSASASSTPPPPTGIEQYTVNNGAPYGDPPDNNMDTDGGSAAFMYNDGAGERLDLLSLYGNGTPYGGYNLCGIQGYTGCSDPVIRFDRVNGDDRWIFTYEDYTPGTPGGSVVLGVSHDSNLSDGFAMYGIGNQTTGSLDAPRLGISSDKVIVTYDYFNGATPARYS